FGWELSVMRLACAKYFSAASSLLLIATLARAEAEYAKDIKPLLKARCYACHGALKQKSGLRVDSVAGLKKGGTDGDVLAGDAILIKRVTASDPQERMPPE